MTSKPRLTPHQKRVLRDIASEHRRTGRPVPEKDSGAPAACAHLVRKGYLTRHVEYGPRGGEHRSYTPVRPVGHLVWEAGRWVKGT